MPAKGTDTACNGLLREFPQLLVMGALEKCSRKVADFPPSCPGSTGLDQGMGTKLVAVTMKRLSGSPESSTGLGSSSLPKPLMMGAQHIGQSPLGQGHRLCYCPALWSGQKDLKPEPKLSGPHGFGTPGLFKHGRGREEASTYTASIPKPATPLSPPLCGCPEPKGSPPDARDNE